jgi:hypothetical protein
LAYFHEQLIKFDGLGSFIAAQVIADLKYIEPFKFAIDWWTFAASGPGSRRGLNRVARPTQSVDANWIEGVWREALKELLSKVNAMLDNPSTPKTYRTASASSTSTNAPAWAKAPRSRFTRRE